MRFLDLTLPTASANLALDEALLVTAEAGQGGEMLRLWSWPAPVVVLGSGGVLADDVDEAACRADGVPVLRRSSGGGTVLWGAGSLQFSLILAYSHYPELSDLHRSYSYIGGRVADALGGAAAGIRLDGSSDLVLGDRKFSGNAQHRKKHHLLHHGTLLHAFEIANIARYLKAPPKQPKYREGRSHADFLCNLPFDADELKRRLRAAWGAEEETTDWPREMVEQLCAEKYDRDDWNRRR
jgi:lipoate-protein ligase A